MGGPSRLKVMISIKDALEAREIMAACGVDMVDIKNPLEGTLGANYPWVIEESLDLLKGHSITAASLGDLTFMPGGASLAAYGVASLGVDFVTASFSRLRDRWEVAEMYATLKRAVEDPGAGLIITGYGDHQRIGGLDPLEILKGAQEADYFMIDTAIKDGLNIFDFLSPRDMTGLMEKAHEQGMGFIVAGSIRHPQIKELTTLQPDAAAFRGIVCRDGTVSRDLVKELVDRLKG